jgi:hypothetical protein
MMETADPLARREYEPYITLGPAPVLGISAEVAREVIRGWTNNPTSVLDKVRLRADQRATEFLT